LLKRAVAPASAAGMPVDAGSSGIRVPHLVQNFPETSEPQFGQFIALLLLPRDMCDKVLDVPGLAPVTRYLR